MWGNYKRSWKQILIELLRNWVSWLSSWCWNTVLQVSQVLTKYRVLLVVAVDRRNGQSFAITNELFFSEGRIWSVHAHTCSRAYHNSTRDAKVCAAIASPNRRNCAAWSLELPELQTTSIPDSPCASFKRCGSPLGSCAELSHSNPAFRSATVPVPCRLQ